MERINGKGVQSLKDSYNSVYTERTEDKIIGEGIMDALKKVGKAVIGPANQSPEAEAARMGKRKPQTKQEKGVAAGTVNKEGADLFDIIKGHLIDEGLTEEEALKKMLDLTEEEREAILDEGLAGMVGSVLSGVKNRMQSGTKRTGNINLPKGGTGTAPKSRGEDIFTSTPPGGKPYGNKKSLPKPGTPAAKNAPMRDEPLF